MVVFCFIYECVNEKGYLLIVCEIGEVVDLFLILIVYGYILWLEKKGYI